MIPSASCSLMGYIYLQIQVCKHQQMFQLLECYLATQNYVPYLLIKVGPYHGFRFRCVSPLPDSVSVLGHFSGRERESASSLYSSINICRTEAQAELNQKHTT